MNRPIFCFVVDVLLAAVLVCFADFARGADPGLEMGIELEAGALDQLPEVAKPARRSQETSAQKIVRLEKRAEASARIAEAKAARMSRVYQKSQQRAYGRRYRLSQPRAPSYAQRAYSAAYRAHARLWAPPPPLVPGC